MKRVCVSGAHRITDLPAEIIQRILVFLPIKSAAKTSVLSRKWRHQWRSIPQLVYDDAFANFANLPGSESDEDTELELMNTQVLLRIYQSLLLHDGAITKFVLSISGLSPRHGIELIILYLSKKGVEHLTLEFRGDSWAADYWQMHSSLFSALHLKSLKLEYCEVAPPSWFVGFNKLTHLELVEVTLPCDFLAKCPMLECLRLKNIDFGDADDKIEIVAPYLKSFSFVDVSIDVCPIFVFTPLLSNLLLHLTGEHLPDMISAFASLPALQQLSVNNEILKYFARADIVPTRLPTPLHLLETLELKLLIFDGSVIERGFLCLIMSSPNLCLLTIQLDGFKLNEAASIWRLLEAEDCPGSFDCLQHLREFRIMDSCGTQVELDLVRFVLSTAPLLRSIRVTPWRKLATQLATKKAMKFMKEVLQYTRISKEAKVVYDWDDEEGWPLWCI